jgi:hypothetical protein
VIKEITKPQIISNDRNDKSPTKTRVTTEEINRDCDFRNEFGATVPAVRAWRSAPLSIDPGLLIAAGLFLVVLIVEALFVAITAPTGLDVGVLYVTGT